jgi:hypothetical protein
MKGTGIMSTIEQARRALAEHNEATLSDKRSREQHEKVIAIAKVAADAANAPAKNADEWAQKQFALQQAELAAVEARQKLAELEARTSTHGQRRALLARAVELEAARIVAREAATSFPELVTAVASVQRLVARIEGAREHIVAQSGNRDVELLRVVNDDMPTRGAVQNAVILTPLASDVHSAQRAWAERAAQLSTEPLPQDTTAIAAE